MRKKRRKKYEKVKKLNREKNENERMKKGIMDK